METASTTSEEYSEPIPLIAPAPVEHDNASGSVGSVIAILLIVALLVVGAFYVWGQRLSEQRADQTVPAIGQ